MKDQLCSLCESREAGRLGAGLLGSLLSEESLGPALSVPQGSMQSSFRRLALAQFNMNVHKEIFIIYIVLARMLVLENNIEHC